MVIAADVTVPAPGTLAFHTKSRVAELLPLFQQSMENILTA